MLTHCLACASFSFGYCSLSCCFFSFSLPFSVSCLCSHSLCRLLSFLALVLSLFSFFSLLSLSLSLYCLLSLLSSLFLSATIPTGSRKKSHLQRERNSNKPVFLRSHKTYTAHALTTQNNFSAQLSHPPFNIHCISVSFFACAPFGLQGQGQAQGQVA